MNNKMHRIGTYWIAISILIGILAGMSEKNKQLHAQKISSVNVTVQNNTFFRDFPQKDIFGNPIIYNKKLYLVDVWATWCPPCRLTIPDLISLKKELAGKNFEIIGLSVDSTQDVVLNFYEQTNINYPVAMMNKETIELLPPVRGIPTMFLMDTNGKILKTYIGYTNKQVFVDDINNYL